MSALRDCLHLAWRYLAHHRWKTALLVAAVAVIVYVPVALNVLVAGGRSELMARAEATPLLVGHRGSALELVLAALYFDTDPPEPTRHAEVDRIEASGLALPIPLHLRFRTRGHPIVGTTLDYLEFRGLRVARGRPMALLGECVVGAAAARALDVSPGDVVVSSPETTFDLAGVYPLELEVVGVLEAAGDADDEAVFVDLRTAWIIEGLGHGHQDLAAAGAESAVLSREGDRIVANASVVEHNRITDENRGSFHFHGDLSDYPVSAVLAVPHDVRSRTLLMGRFEGPDEASLVVRPSAVMAELLETVLTIRAYLMGAFTVVAIATGATLALVFALSIRLRRREIETMADIGGAQGRIVGVLAAEVLLVLALGSAGAAALTAMTERYGAQLIRALVAS